MLNWIMKRFGASVEELANETFEELMGYVPRWGTGEMKSPNEYTPEEEAEAKKGHKPPRHDIQKLKDLHDLSEASRFIFNDDPNKSPAEAGGNFNAEGEQWRQMTEMTPQERQAALIYEEVQSELRDTAQTGYFEDQEGEDPYKMTLEVMTGKHRYWVDVLDNAIRNADTAELRRNKDAGHTIQPEWNEEEARKVLSSMLKKQQMAQAPKIYKAIKNGLSKLREDYPESYKLWPWYVKNVKQYYTNNFNANRGGLAQSAYAHWVDVVGNAGKQLAELRRENRLPHNFDINKLDFDGLEQWFMDWKRENRESNDQGEVVYQWDDGWTIQRLTDDEQLQYEGDTMGHCVGDYAHPVMEGSTLIYSLRDPKGKPHVTMEMDAPELLKQVHDKPMSEFNDEDTQQMIDANGGKKLDGLYPTPLFKDGQDQLNYANYTGLGKENLWPTYATQRKYVSPHDVKDDDKYYNRQGVPWDKSFYVVQVQGNSNLKPKPEYQKRITEFLDYLKSKGFKFQRSDEWYPNDDARNEFLGGYDTYTEYATRNGRWDNHEDNLLGWHDHFQENPETYLGGDDQYGIQTAPKYTGYSPGIVEDTLRQVLTQGEDPDHAAWATMQWAIHENMAYTDMDDAVRNAEGSLRDEMNAEEERAWESDNGTWIYHNEETGQDEEVEDYDNIPENAIWNPQLDDDKGDGWKYLNALDTYLRWAYENKDQVKKDLHPSMSKPRIDWGRQYEYGGGQLGFIPGTDPYGATDDPAQAAQVARQDAGPGFSTPDMTGVFSSVRTAEKEHDPDYVFVYYMSELRVEEWAVNTRYEEILEKLLDEFNVDLGNSLMDIKPTDVAAGEIRIRNGRPEVEHEQLCPPEIREQAEEAIGQWWANQWLEGIKEHDWYAVDESHTLTGDGS